MSLFSRFGTIRNNTALKRIGLYNKRLSCFGTILQLLSGYPIIYIDETGIDTYLTRPRARAPRGHKVLEKISGRRFESISVVAGQIGNQFVAPMIYKESMTSDFFMKWFSEELLSSLSETHVIVMIMRLFTPRNN